MPRNILPLCQSDTQLLSIVVWPLQTGKLLDSHGIWSATICFYHVTLFEILESSLHFL